MPFDPCRQRLISQKNRAKRGAASLTGGSQPNPKEEKELDAVTLAENC